MAGYGFDNPYNTSYGAQGGADGGGFMQGEVTSSPSGGKGDYGKDTVRPLTIKQILDAEEPYPDAGHQVDRVPINHITFVGQIRNISSQTTNITYKVDDGTGTIEVKQWNDGENPLADQMGNDSDSKPKLAEEGYCRVWGKLKAFNNKKHVGAHVIRPITDYNEINYHLLEATAVHLFFTRGPPDSGKGQNGVKGNTNAADGQQEVNSHGQSLPSMSSGARKLLNTLKTTPQSNEGLHVQVLASQMATSTDEAQRAAEELISLGLIFTTVDDFTWALLDY